VNAHDLGLPDESAIAGEDLKGGLDNLQGGSMGQTSSYLIENFDEHGMLVGGFNQIEKY